MYYMLFSMHCRFNKCRWKPLHHPNSLRVSRLHDNHRQHRDGLLTKLRTSTRSYTMNVSNKISTFLFEHNDNINIPISFSEPPSTEKPVQENIIETKPPPTVVTKIDPETINPSKLSDSKDNTNKPVKQDILASAVTVVTSPPKTNEVKQVISKVEVVSGSSKIVENKPTPAKSNKKQNKPVASPAKAVTNTTKKLTNNIVSSKVEVKQGTPSSVVNTKLSSVVSVQSSDPDEEPAILINNNNIGEPEYDFLSRQPSEFVEETYKVINLRPSKAHAQKPKKSRPTPPPEDDDEHPLGLVTTLGGTIVRDGLTTVHETSVIGTYISGKYAQVLNSNSKVFGPSGHKPKISPTPTHRILKTPAPTIAKSQRFNLEPTPSISDETGFEHNSNKNARRHTSSAGSFKNRLRSQNNNENEQENANQNKKFKNRHTSSSSQRTQR